MFSQLIILQHDHQIPVSFRQCKVYIGYPYYNRLTMGHLSLWSIIHSLKLVDYTFVQADEPYSIIIVCAFLVHITEKELLMPSDTGVITSVISLG